MPSSRKRRLHRGGRGLLHVGQDVRVGAQGDPYGGVAELFRDHLGVVTPSPSSNVAQVCLRSWKRVVEGTPAHSLIRLNERLRKTAAARNRRLSPHKACSIVGQESKVCEAVFGDTPERSRRTGQVPSPSAAARTSFENAPSTHSGEWAFCRCGGNGPMASRSRIEGANYRKEEVHDAVGRDGQASDAL